MTTIVTPTYLFSAVTNDDGTVEVSIRLPSSAHAQPNISYEGAEARKAAVQWICSSAVTIAKVCGVDMQDLMLEVYADTADQIDCETLIQVISEKPHTEESLSSNPPEGIDTETAKLLIEAMIEAGAITLDDTGGLHVVKMVSPTAN
jgi:hypothetical protein